VRRLEDLRTRLVRRAPLVLDGATGSELTRRGVATRLPLWSAAALLDEAGRATVAAIHADYVAAGAEVVTANTFRTTGRALEKAGLATGAAAERRAAELTQVAVELVRRARPRFVAGSMATLEDCYEPELVPDASTLAREHAAHARDLAQAGIDLLLVETMNSVREAVAAARAALATDLPVVVGLVCGADGRLLSHERVAEAARTLLAEGVHGLAINCTPSATLHGPLAELVAAVDGRVTCGAWGNVGSVDELEGWRTTSAFPPPEFAALGRSWHDLGSNLVGGCCGTTPEHVAELAQALRNA